MPKGKRRVQVQMTPAVKLAGTLLKIATKVAALMAPKYDSAGIHSTLSSVKVALEDCGKQAQALPDNWKPGKPKKPMSAEQIKKLEAKAAKLAEQIAEAKAAQA